MCSCDNCIHTRVCGQKDKYKQYVKEFNELNEKWDVFEKNPKCPEYTDSNLLKINNQGNWFEEQSKKKDINTYYSSGTKIKDTEREKILKGNIDEKQKSKGVSDKEDIILELARQILNNYIPISQDEYLNTLAYLKKNKRGWDI